jgi:predicted dehydrogenase
VRQPPRSAGRRGGQDRRAGFASLDALLAAGSDADIVVLATPSGLHPRQAMRPRRPAATC